MLKAFGLLTAFAVLSAAPALAKGKEAEFRVWTETDRFKPGIVTARSTPIRVKDVKFTSPWFATLEAGYIYSEDGTVGIYVFDVKYFGHDWMFWNELTAKVGGDVRSLKMIGQPSREQVPLGLQEQIRFEVPRDFFEKMTTAPSVDFRVNGKYYYDFFLNSTGTSYLKQLQDFTKSHAPELKVKSLPGSDIGGGQQEAKSEAPAYIQELRELAKLRDDGIISEEEFQVKKRKLLDLNAEEKPSPEKSGEEPGDSKKPPSGSEPAAASAGSWHYDKSATAEPKPSRELPRLCRGILTVADDIASNPTAGIA